MTEKTSTPVVPSRWPGRCRLFCRAAGAVAVILGGWCLWLAFSSTNQPMDIEALQDLEPNTAEPPRQLAADRVSVEITQITANESGDSDDRHRVVPALQESVTPDRDAEAIHPIRFESPAGPDVGTSPASSQGAWLTGDIEEARDSDELPQEMPDIPAWRRTTKSLKSVLKETARPALRR